MNMSVQTVQMIGSQTTALGPQAYHQQDLHPMSFECLEEFNLLLLDCPRVQSKQTVAACQSCNHRDITPVEMKLGDGCLTLGHPSAYRCRSLAYPGLVDKSNDSALSLGFLLSAVQVHRRQASTASSLRSMARFSGFYQLKPNASRMRQTWLWLKRTLFSAHMLECPQLGAKAMGARALQHCFSHIGQLPGIKCA
jgi:hypothetical protein